MMKKLILKFVRALGYDLVPIRFVHAQQALILKPLDPVGVELLADRSFQDSCRQVYDHTLLDTPRLANLWQLSRLANPRGHILEVGAYRGGSALHLANACPDRAIYVCDSFRGFRSLDPALDHAFQPDMFRDTSKEHVERLFHRHGRPATIVAGYFPESCADLPLAPLSFVHLDLDTHEATRAALEFLAPRMIDRSLMVLDDFCRTADGVNRALAEFLDRATDWALFPLFPSQALLVHRTWFARDALSQPEGALSA
jgi:hypothetical protein